LTQSRLNGTKRSAMIVKLVYLSMTVQRYLTPSGTICISSLSHSHIFGGAKCQTHLISQIYFLILSLTQCTSEKEREEKDDISVRYFLEARLQVLIKKSFTHYTTKSSSWSVFFSMKERDGFRVKYIPDCLCLEKLRPTLRETKGLE